MRHPFLDLELGEFAWCLHCEQASKSVDCASNDWDCPVEGCDGGAFDIRPWEEIAGHNPEYPERPEQGTLYGLYGGTSS